MSLLTDRIAHCLLLDCFSIPEDEFEFHAYLPLYQSPLEELWSETESEGTDEGSEEELEAIEIPEKCELKRRFIAESNGQPKLTVDHSVKFVQITGFAPSKADEARVREMHKDGLDFDELRSWMEEIRHKEDSLNHLISVFKRFDPEHTGKLSKSQLRTILTKHGETLTDAEFDDLLS